MADETPPAEAPPAEAPPAAETPPAAPAPWIDGITDADTRSWAESKGLEKGSFENVLGSYRNLEKLMGADKAGNTFLLPGDDATPEQMGEHYTRLGRPEKAEGYGLAAPEGESPDFSNWASGVFHEAGLSAKQAAFIAEKWDTYVGDTNTARTTADTTAQTDSLAELKTHWGAAFDQNMAQMDKTAENLGMNEQQLVGLRNSMGGAAAAKFIHGLGAQLGEDTMDVGDAVTGGILTPDQAREALVQLNSNEEFMTAWLNKSHIGHKAAVEKKAGLARMVAGQAA
ncbi:MAG: hypothetical protein ABGX63_02590 [bacterium]